MKSLLKMTWMEAKLFLREPVGAFFTLVFPLMMLFLFGSIYGNKPTPMFNGHVSDLVRERVYQQTSLGILQVIARRECKRSLE